MVKKTKKKSVARKARPARKIDYNNLVSLPPPSSSSDEGEGLAGKILKVLIMLGFVGMIVILAMSWKKALDNAENTTMLTVMTVAGGLLILFWFFMLR